MSKNRHNTKNNFSVFCSFRTALFFRAFELIILTAILYISNLIFTDLNLLAVVIVGTPTVILISYLLFRKIFNTNQGVIKSGSDKTPEPLCPEKRKFILEIIKIRLDGIGEATKRARITFIISIIASCSMLITLFNTYYSWTQRRGFDNSFKYKAVEINNEKEFTERINRIDPKSFFSKYVKPLSKKKCKAELEAIKEEDDYKNAPDQTLFKDNYVTTCSGKLEETYTIPFKSYKEDFDKFDNYITSQENNLSNINTTQENNHSNISTNSINSEKLKSGKEILNSKLEKSRKSVLRLINENLLGEPELYEFCGEKKEFYECFATKEKVKTIEDEKKEKRGDELKDKIKKKISSEEITTYYDSTNHLNKIILQKIFPEIEWRASVQEIGLPISIYEDNKRALSKEWIENQNVRINLLGISVNVDQFSLIGSFTLMVITIWMLFSVRRENRSIVTLLRDVRKYVGYPKRGKSDDELQPPEKTELHDNWKIADLTLHGIAHNLIFSQIGRYDLPMSENNIFDLKNEIPEPDTNNITEIATKFIRAFAYLLLFLPAISIVLIIYIDQQTTTNLIYPYSNNPIEYFINRNIHNFPRQIGLEIKIGIIFGLITWLVCFTCFIYQKRTASAMKTFEEQLGKEDNPEVNPEDSWWEKYMRPLWKSFKSRLFKNILGENQNQT
jgi:hypothetical protein